MEKLPGECVPKVSPRFEEECSMLNRYSQEDIPQKKSQTNLMQALGLGHLAFEAVADVHFTQTCRLADSNILLVLVDATT